MPIQSISGPEAFENMRSNAQNTWPKRGSPEDRVGPIAAPGFHPTFTLEPGESVFTIGSCFARNVETALFRLGFDVPMRQVKISDGPGDSGVFNNYAAPSILNELEWALDPEKPFDPKTCLVEVSRGKFCDLHLTRLLKPTDIDRAMEIRLKIKEGMSAAANCRIIIITLGLVEVWWDSAAERYLNTAPPKQVVLADPGRFELRVLGVDEVRHHLERVVELLRQFGRPDHRIILTVSPVPLAITFTQQDVILANTYSKAVLRVVAQELWNKYDHIDYYPSYESAVLSERGSAWQDDNRHVLPSVIDLNVSRMVRAYIPGNEVPRLSEAFSAEKARNFATAQSIYAELLGSDDDVPARLGLGRCLAREGKFDEAILSLNPLDDNDDADVVRAEVYRRGGDVEKVKNMEARLLKINTNASLRELIFGMYSIKAYLRTINACDALAKISPRSYLPFQYKAMVNMRKGEFEAAYTLLQEAVLLNANAVEVFTLLGRVALKLGRLDDARDACLRALELNSNAREAAEVLGELNRASR